MQNPKNVEIAEIQIAVSIMLPYGGSEMQPLRIAQRLTVPI